MNGWMEKCHSDTREGATLPELPDQVTVCCRKLISPSGKEAWGLACVGLWLPQDVRISLVRKKKVRFNICEFKQSWERKEKRRRKGKERRKPLQKWRRKCQKGPNEKR